MDPDEAWSHTTAMRVALREVLRDLSPEEWEQPSLCAGWRVRDTAAHMIAGPQLGWGSSLKAMTGIWRGLDRMTLLDGQRRGSVPVEEILGQFDTWAEVPKGPVFVTYREALIDALVHSQDIVRPLGRTLDMPVEAAAVAADRVRSMSGLFGTRRLISEVRMVATDVDWVRGSGREVRAPMADLLMMSTGRPVADAAA